MKEANGNQGRGNLLSDVPIVELARMFVDTERAGGAESQITRILRRALESRVDGWYPPPTTEPPPPPPPEPKDVWVCGRFTSTEALQQRAMTLRGVFTEPKKALAACETPDDFFASIKLDVAEVDPLMAFPAGVYFPVVEKVEDAK